MSESLIQKIMQILPKTNAKIKVPGSIDKRGE